MFTLGAEFCLSAAAAELDLEASFSSRLARRAESIVVELPLRPALRAANLWPDTRDVESQARPAALEDAAGVPTLCPPEVLDGLEGFFPSLVRKVVNIRLRFSGLGVLDLYLGCGGKVGGVGDW